MESLDGITVAASPFDQPSVDLILRSSGHVYFHVHRAILTQASPVFADMFSIPQPSTAPQSDHPPVVDVSETEETLRCLLLLCYPLNKPHMESLQDVEPVLMAAIKYDMEWPLSFLSDRLQSAIADHPLRVWAIACRAGLAGIAQQAAATMKAPQASTETMTASIRTHLQAEGLGVLDRIGAGTYYRLREYLRSPSSSCVFTILPVPSTVPPPATVKSPSSTPSSLDITPSFITPDLPVDITLKCSDNVRVKTHKLMLVVHMPKNPHIVQVEDGGTVEIHFPSQTVVDLLRVCYLTEVGLPLTLDRIARALEASQSLGMDGVAAALHRRWKEKAASSPVAAFFAAAAHELDSDYIHDTARSTLRAKILGLYVKQMEDVAALVYHHLLQYHHDASLAVDGVLEKKQDAFRSDTFKLMDSPKFSEFLAVFVSVFVCMEPVHSKLRSGHRAPAASIKDLDFRVLLHASARLGPDISRRRLSKYLDLVQRLQYTLQPAIDVALSQVKFKL